MRLKRSTLAGSIFIIFAFAIACNEDGVSIGPPTVPSPPPTVPPDPPPPVDPPVNRGIEFSWQDTRGILVFAGIQATEGEIRTLDSRLRSKGWPTPTYHVCAEVQSWGWEGSPWADGPKAFSYENIENLERFLKVTAELGSQVLLDVVCTMKEDGTWFADQTVKGVLVPGILSWTKKVGNIAGPYNHVAIHLGNEIWHPQSSLRNYPSRWVEMRNALISAGFMGMIATDDNSGNPNDTKASRDILMVSDWTDFHPFRNPDPGPGTLKAYVEDNPGPVVISEPTAYSSWRDGYCCTSDRDQIIRYMNRAESAGIVWFYHSTDGLQWPSKAPHFEWIP